MAKRVKKTKPTVPQIILDMFDFSATSRHVWADESWRLRVAAMMMWHLSRHEADFALREPDRALVIPRGMGNSDLLSVFMLLAGCAIEAIAKGIYMRRKKVKITHGRFPRALQNHDVGGLLKSLGVSLTIDEEALVRRLGTFVRWAGRYPVPLDAADMLSANLPEGGFGPPNMYRLHDGEMFEALFSRLEVLLLG